MDFEDGEIVWTSRGEDSGPAEAVVVQRRGQAPEIVAMPAMKRIDRWATLAEFAAAIRNGREPQSSGRDNLGTLALVHAAVDSAALGKPVAVRARRT